MNAPDKQHAHLPTEDDFHKLIHENHMWGLWELASAMTPHPMPEAIPYMWKWSLIDSICKESGTAVPVDGGLTIKNA